MKRPQILKSILLFCLLPLAVAAQNDPIKVPTEVKPFVLSGMVPIALESGDLNGDGTKDFILVLDKPFDEKAQVDEAGMDNRPMLILIRDAAGKLSLAARNDLVAYCRTCGGVMGDPFTGITIRGTGFTVDNYGGSSDRWSNSFTFDYSRRDREWQLTRVEQETFNTFTPDKVKKSVFTPPKNFGLISFPDFDPQNFKGKGKR